MIVIDLSAPPAEVAELLHRNLGAPDSGDAVYSATFSGVYFPRTDPAYAEVIDQLFPRAIVLTSPELRDWGLLVRREPRYRDFSELDRECVFCLRVPDELGWEHRTLKIGIEKTSEHLDKQVADLRQRKRYFAAAHALKELLPAVLGRAAAQNVERQKAAAAAATMPTAAETVAAKQRK